jgi:late competence protein required for DNA uptake (superfamily II DNA/RNA helicase)
LLSSDFNFLTTFSCIDFFIFAKSDDNKKIKKSSGLKIDSNLNIRNHNNKIIVPKELKLKNIQKEIRKPITPKCQFKWDTIF